MPISLRSAEFAATFERGLDSFLSEARLLASFDHPNLVKVHRFWKANGTAYMAMQHYPGETLKDVRWRMSSPPDQEWLPRSSSRCSTRSSSCTARACSIATSRPTTS